MRTNLLTAFLVAAAVVSPAVASADAADSLVGRYDVAFEQVTSNCQDRGLALGRSVVVVISKRAPGVAVEVTSVATLGGKAAKAGRLKAASAVGKTTLAGLDGKFSIAGSVDDTGKLDAVFVGEYYEGGKPLCTQSWSATGLRTAAPRPPAPGQQAPAAAPTSSMTSTMFTRFGDLAPAE